MKKRWILALALILCLCLLTACKKEGEKFAIKTNPSLPLTGQTQQNPAQPADPDEGYNPLDEEDDYTQGVDDSWLEDLATPAPAPATAVPTIRSEYAGATPIPIDPIDKPTPTPVPPLAAFAYKTYEATKLGVAFDAPMGWLIDESQNGYYIIQNPAPGLYPATLTIHAEKVSEQYSTSQLESVIKSMLNAIGQDAGVDEYSPSTVDDRSLLGAKGRYANYSAVMTDGRKVKGRVHATCVDKVLYTVHLSAPAEYWDTYKEQVYDKLRDTIKLTK